MRNIKLTLEYDGTDFIGWQTQATGRSVQEEVAKVLRELLQEEVTLHGAGRTDSGVHARGQVANFLTSSSRDLKSLRDALSGMLPADICVHAAEEVPEQFHARYDATSRVYRYTISLVQNAIGRHYHWHVKHALELPPMQRVAKAIMGDHDFGSFCKSDSGVRHHRCIVTKSEWVTLATGIVYEVRANRFLYGMVRALVGTMVDVGRGYTTDSEFVEIIKAKDRSRAGMAAPAHGLCLEEVSY